MSRAAGPRPTIARPTDGVGAVAISLLGYALLAMVITRTQQPVETRNLVWQHLGRDRP